MIKLLMIGGFYTDYHIVDHVVQKEGEVDFVGVYPVFGGSHDRELKVIEIKYEEGLWYFKKPQPEKKSPLTQAKENMWSLMDLIKQHEKKPTGFGGVRGHISVFSLLQNLNLLQQSGTTGK